MYKRQLFDLCRRIDSRKVNKRVLEALIKAGALDSLGQHRAAMMADLSRAMTAAEQQMAAKTVGQSDMFGMATAAEAAAPIHGSTDVTEWSDLVRLGFEKDTLGLYVTGHPFSGFEAELSQLTSGRIAELVSNAASGIDNSNDAPAGRRRRNKGQEVTLAGLAVDLRRFGNRTIVTLDDRSGRVECMLFENTSRAVEHFLDKDKILLVKGKLAYDDYADGFRVTVEELMDLDAVRERLATRVLLRLESNAELDIAALERNLSVYRDDQGCLVSLRYINQQARAWFHLGEQWRVRPCDGLMNDLQRLLGPQSVKFGYRGERQTKQTDEQQPLSHAQAS